MPDELMSDLIKEAQIHLTQLNTLEVASQLTLEDFKVFKEIQDTEYIDEIFKLKSKYGCPNLDKFSDVSFIGILLCLYCLPDNLNLILSILKAFADDRINVTQRLNCVLGRAENFLPFEGFI